MHTFYVFPVSGNTGIVVSTGATSGAEMPDTVVVYVYGMMGKEGPIGGVSLSNIIIYMNTNYF